jgi:hypothetical protein
VLSHGLGVNGAIDVIDQPELAKSGVEEGAPSRKCGVAVVEGDCHMSADIDVLDGSTVVGELSPKGFWELAMEEAGLDAMGRG